MDLPNNILIISLCFGCWITTYMFSRAIYHYNLYYVLKIHVLLFLYLSCSEKLSCCDIYAYSVIGIFLLLELKLVVNECVVVELFAGIIEVSCDSEV